MGVDPMGQMVRCTACRPPATRHLEVIILTDALECLAMPAPLRYMAAI